MNSERLSRLQERAAQLAESIAFFEAKREEILGRRHGAADHVMVDLDERLKLNAATLAALRRTLDLTMRDLEAEQKNPVRGE